MKKEISIDVTKHKVFTGKISRQESLTIIQLSDLHSNEYNVDNNRIMQIIQDARPDLVVTTGDMINISDKSIEKTLRLLGKIALMFPVYYIYGNHEESNKYITLDNIKNKLTNVGVKVLDNENVEISQSIHLYGIGYQRRSSKTLTKAADDCLKKLNKSKYNILLSHNPDCLKTHNKYGIDLILSGHIHGGAIRLFNKGLLSPYRIFFPKYDSGMYESKDKITKMIVSRGMGDCSFKFRLFNNLEIVKVQILSCKNK